MSHFCITQEGPELFSVSFQMDEENGGYKHSLQMFRYISLARSWVYALEQSDQPQSLRATQPTVEVLFPAPPEDGEPLGRGIPDGMSRGDAERYNLLPPSGEMHLLMRDGSTHPIGVVSGVTVTPVTSALERDFPLRSITFPVQGEAADGIVLPTSEGEPGIMGTVFDPHWQMAADLFNPPALPTREEVGAERRDRLRNLRQGGGGAESGRMSSRLLPYSQHDAQVALDFNDLSGIDPLLHRIRTLEERLDCLEGEKRALVEKDRARKTRKLNLGVVEETGEEG